MQAKFPKFDIAPYRKKLGEFCKQWNVKTVSLYGSASREDFSAESDIDLLVTFQTKTEVDLFDFVDMKEQLEKLFGRPVDLTTHSAINGCRNPLRKKEILNTAQIIYDKAA